MLRRPVVLIAGALLALVIAGCGVPPAPGVTVTVSSNAPITAALLRKLPTNTGPVVGDPCLATPCTFIQTGAELAATPDGYFVQVTAPTTFTYTCTATDTSHSSMDISPNGHLAACIYDGTPPDLFPGGSHNPKLAAGTATPITVTFPTP